MRWVPGRGLALLLFVNLALAQSVSLNQLLLASLNRGAQEVYLVLGNSVLGPQETGRLQEMVRAGVRVGIFVSRCPDPRVVSGLPYHAFSISVGGPGKRDLLLLAYFRDGFLAAQGQDPRLLQVLDSPWPPAPHARDLLQYNLGFEAYRTLAREIPRCPG